MPGRVFRGIVRRTGPDLALQEILYGFIMALIFVSAARIGILQYEGKWDLVVLIAGMNLTWGAIDAIVFYMVDVFNQRKFVRLMENTDMTSEERLELMIDEFSGTPLDILDPEGERAVCEQILRMKLEDLSERQKDRRAMRDSALGCFAITALTIIPVVLPILLVPDITMGLTASSILSAVVLFFVGFRMESQIGVNRWISGLVLTSIAWAITIVATYTGG